MNIADITLLRKQITEDVFLTKYQQNPESSNFSIIKIKNLQLFEEIKFDKYYFSIDTASSLNIMADYTVILIFAFNDINFYLLDIIRDKFEYTKLKEKIFQLIKKWNPVEILIENKGIGISLIQEIGKNNNIKAINPKISKEARLYQVLHFIEQKRVFVSKLLSKNEDLIEELRKFPKTKHDDQVDAIVQGLQFFKEKMSFEQKENKFAKIRFI
jgi:predicted phage terminase large subunit-like protein